MAVRRRVHIDTPRIVQPGSHNSLWLWLLFLVLAVLLAWQAFEYGRHRGGFDAEASEEALSQLQQRVVTLKRERDELRLTAARMQRSSQIDQTAVSEVQDELKALQEERSQLRQEVEFLKSLVSGDATMLQLTELKLYDLDQGNRYAFSFTVSKRAEDDKRVRGRATLAVVGQLKGEAATLQAEALNIDSKGMALGFVHFQKIEGELTLPVGFIPRELVLGIKPGDDKFKALEQTFPWKVESD